MAKLVPSTTRWSPALSSVGFQSLRRSRWLRELPAAFVRKEARGFGTAKLAEGVDVAGRRVLIIEDVITAVSQAAASAAQLRDEGDHSSVLLFALGRIPESDLRLSFFGDQALACRSQGVAVRPLSSSSWAA